LTKEGKREKYIMMLSLKIKIGTKYGRLANMGNKAV
jgi:hypothetical protein